MTDHTDTEADLDLYRVVGLATQPSIMDTIVQFAGYAEGDDETLYRIAVDHRPARDIVEILCDEGECLVACEGWAVSRLPEGWEVLFPATM